VGCCGMAEAFGYEKEHSAFSRQIAAKNLLPRLAEVPRCLCSSQRFFLPHQISDLSDGYLLRVAEVLSAFVYKVKQKESY